MTNSTSTLVVPAYNASTDEYVALQVSGKKLVNITKQFGEDCAAFGRDGSVKLWYCLEHNAIITGTKDKKGMDYKGTRPSIRTFIDPKVVESQAKEMKVELPKKLLPILNSIQTLMNKKNVKEVASKKASSKKNQNPTSKKTDTKVAPVVEVAKS